MAYKKYYVPLTQTQIKQAQHTDIAEFLRSRGETVKREGSKWVWEAHDSLKITGYMWYQNSTGKSGAAVAFVEHFFQMSFPDAVLTLINESAPVTETFTEKKHKPKPVFMLPTQNDDMRRTYAYLAATRKIDTDIITYFVDEKLIYEDTKHNIVFVCYDKDDIARGAHKKGTSTFGKPFRGVVSGTDVNCGFAYNGTGEKLYVFEAPIDLLSFICINRHYNWTKDSFLSLGGLHEQALISYIKTHQHIKKICFCFDNDINGKTHDDSPCNHGQVTAEDYSAKYAKKEYITKILTPTLKDWNEELKLIRT